MKLSSTPIGSARAGLSRPTRRLVDAPRTASSTSAPASPTSRRRRCPTRVRSCSPNPSVAEEKRFCSACGAPVGRGRATASPAAPRASARSAAPPYSFAPKLHAGDVVGGQYEVVGCIAHGGLGWIYLARDHNVSDRYVVLKGLLNTGDEDAFEAAVAERQFLAEVQHPLIVEIYNFAQLDGAGYIVMEYVGGRSLKQILKDRMDANGGQYDPFPVDQAIAYIVEILPAFSYLHSQGLLYCDFKPDNVIQAGDTLKLIDLGGVRRVDDDQSAIYGTVGFQAPEVAEVGPSVAERHLHDRPHARGARDGVPRLPVDLRRRRLPAVDDTPLFQRYDSLYRVLAKATATNPDDRFQSADELRDQLLGVLREVVAVDSGVAAAAHSNPSTLFGAPTGDRRRPRAGRICRRCAIDRADPSATWLAGVSLADRRAAARGARAGARADRRGAAREGARRDRRRERSPSRTRWSNDVLTDNPWEWRAVWLVGPRGPGSLPTSRRPRPRSTPCSGRCPASSRRSSRSRSPASRRAPSDLAEQLYAVCAATDANYVAPAAFGLARTRERRGDVAGSLAALDLVAPDERCVRRGPPPARRAARPRPGPASTTSPRPRPASRTSRSTRATA